MITIENPQNRDLVTFLKTSRETNGEQTLIEVTLAPGGRNALHFHTRFTETFIAVERPLQLGTADGDKTLAPGESFAVPPHVEHCFFNDSQETVRFQVDIRPGNEAFECFLQVAYGIIRETWTLPGGFPLNPLYLGVLYELGDTHYRGPLEWMSPLAKSLAWLARRTGTKRRLMERFCETLALASANTTKQLVD